VIFKSSEQQFYERIRDEILLRLAPTSAPEAIESFLIQHWSRLLRDIYLSRGDDHPDWQAGWDTVDALLWSLTPLKTRQETERLLRLLPILRGRLEEGCAALGLPAAERDALLGLLAQQHAAAARAGSASLGDRATEDQGSPSRSAVAGAPPPGAQAKPGLPSRDRLEELRPGDWLTFRCAEGDKRLCLQWISATGAMFLFADSQGLDALSLTRQRLQERWSRGEVALAG
jgi:hypothetical protein